MGGGRSSTNREQRTVSESILRGMEGHWFNAIASHCEVESDGGSQLVLMTMQFQSETRMQISGSVDANVLRFLSILDESRVEEYEHMTSNNEM